MTVIDGRFVGDSRATILDALVADAKEYWGQDMSDGMESAVVAFYEPVAGRMAELQDDIGLVLDSAQLAHAEGLALDFLTALIGVRRNDAEKATGTARFSRATAASKDYTIPKGTYVQTEGVNPVRFTTDASATLAINTTSVDVAITAEEGGVEANVGANTLTVMPSPPTGIEDVTNPAATSGGVEEETDDELRLRAEEQLSEGSAATPNALLTAIQNIAGVKSVSYFGNPENTADVDGLPPHSGEFVVEGGNAADIAQVIADKKAWGDTLASGVHGTADGPHTVSYVNGQTDSLTISRPTDVLIYVDMDVQTTADYEGDSVVFDSIVSYIGGLKTTGSTDGGQLGVGDDVIIGEVEYAIRSVQGVHDVTSLTIDTVSPPAGTTNIAIADGSVATSDATNGSMTITTTQV